MAKKGEPKTGGRRKGARNKTTRQVKDMVLDALERAGGEEYLARQAEDNPSAFLGLIKSVIPLQVKNEVGGILEITWKD
jgi:hypothetical protein